MVYNSKTIQKIGEAFAKDKNIEMLGIKYNSETEEEERFQKLRYTNISLDKSTVLFDQEGFKIEVYGEEENILKFALYEKNGRKSTINCIRFNPTNILGLRRPFNIYSQSVDASQGNIAFNCETETSFNHRKFYQFTGRIGPLLNSIPHNIVSSDNQVLANLKISASYNPTTWSFRYKGEYFNSFTNDGIEIEKMSESAIELRYLERELKDIAKYLFQLKKSYKNGEASIEELLKLLSIRRTFEENLAKEFMQIIDMNGTKQLMLRRQLRNSTLHRK